MADGQNEGRLHPLKTYVVQEEANMIKTLAKDEGVSVSHYLRQKLKRLITAQPTKHSIERNLK